MSNEDADDSQACSECCRRFWQRRIKKWMIGNTCVASTQGVVTWKVNPEVTGMKREVVQNRTKKY